MKIEYCTQIYSIAGMVIQMGALLFSYNLSTCYNQVILQSRMQYIYTCASVGQKHQSIIYVNKIRLGGASVYIIIIIHQIAIYSQL